MPPRLWLGEFSKIFFDRLEVRVYSVAMERVLNVLLSALSLAIIFAASNFMLIGALLALMRRGLKVLDAVVRVCFHDVEPCSSS